jgi:hypothetical protein
MNSCYAAMRRLATRRCTKNRFACCRESGRNIGGGYLLVITGSLATDTWFYFFQFLSITGISNNVAPFSK